jgi:hypothetical protein
MRLKRMIASTGWFPILLLLTFVPACQADVSAPTEIERGFQSMYNLQFDEAHQDFAIWERLHPDDPLGPVSQAAGYLFAEFARPDDSNALFARILALGLRSDYVALIDKEDFAALHYMKQGRILAQQLLKQKPDEYDALLAVGVENYLTGIKPAPVRWMLSLGGIDPDKEQGIRELQQTAAHGNLLKPFAKLLLAVAALRDKNNAEGCNLLNELATEYPRNPLYRNSAPECRGAH